MTKYKLLLSSVLSLTIFFNVANAEDTSSKFLSGVPEGCLDKNIVLNQSVSLIDLIKIGICNNPSLRIDYISQKIAEENLGSAKSEYFPDINISARAQKTTNKKQNTSSVENNPYGINIGLSLLLYDFGGRSSRIDSFKSYLASAGFDYNASLQNLILSIQTAYFKLLGAKEDLISAKANEAMYKKTFDEARRKYDVGLAALNDKLQTQTSYEQSRLKVIEVENLVKQYEGELATILDLPPQTQFNLKEPPKDRDLTALDKKDTIEKLIEVAIKDRDEIKSQEMSLNAANSSLQELRASRYGSFSLSADSGYNNSWKDTRYYQRDNTIGLSYNLPLFTGFDTTHKISSAKYKREQERQALEDIKNQIRNEVWSAYHDYQTALKSYDVSKKLLKSAEENEKVAFKSYEIGQTDIINLLTAESQLADARDTLVVAFYTVLINKAKLYRSVGRY